MLSAFSSDYPEKIKASQKAENVQITIRPKIKSNESSDTRLDNPPTVDYVNYV